MRHQFEAGRAFGTASRWTGAAWDVLGGVANPPTGRGGNLSGLALDAKGVAVVAYTRGDGTNLNAYQKRVNQ